MVARCQIWLYSENKIKSWAIESLVQFLTDRQESNFIEFRCGECCRRSTSFSVIKGHIERVYRNEIEAMRNRRYVERAFSILISYLNLVLFVLLSLMLSDAPLPRSIVNVTDLCVSEWRAVSRMLPQISETSLNSDEHPRVGPSNATRDYLQRTARHSSS